MNSGNSSSSHLGLESSKKGDVVIHCMEVEDNGSNTSTQHGQSYLYPIDTHVDPDEVQVLREQTALGNSSVKFFTLFRYATLQDIIILTLAYLCAIISGAALPFTNFVLGELTQDFADLITNNIDPQDFQPEVVKYTMCFVYLGLGVGITSCISTYLLADRGEILAGRIRKHYFEAIIRQNSAYFEHIGYSEVTKRIIDDTHLIQEAISENSGIATSSIASFISALVVGFISSWKITCLMICAIASVGICAALGISRIKKWDSLIEPYQDNTNFLVSQIIKSIHTSSAFGASQNHAKRLDEKWKLIMELSFRRTYAISLSVAGCWAIVYAAYALDFWQGSIEVENWTIDQGSLITTITAIIMGGFTVSSIWPVIRSIMKGIESGERIFETIDRISTVDSTSESGIILKNLKGKIEFENIRLRFPSDPNNLVIEDLNLCVEAGETIAITGPSGSGKSALFGLIEQYYAPVKGRILIDNINIVNLNTQALRQNIAYVSQDPFLFSGTIYDNIIQGLERSYFANEDESVKTQLITKACKDANAWGFILSLKDGLYSQVGEKGCLLTISQRQRIALARAIISQPKIFLFDEATSALSPKSEAIVLKSLEHITKKCTTIFITQNLSILQSADKVVVLKDGAILEQGTHLKLMNDSVWYSKFIEQQKEYVAKDKNPRLMFSKNRQPSEVSTHLLKKGSSANTAYDILNWKSVNQENPILETHSPLIQKSSETLNELSSSSLIGMVGISVFRIY